MQTIKVDVDLQPVQVELFNIYLNSKSTRIGFGGSRGGSKSYTLDLLMIYRRQVYSNTSGLLVMKQYQDIWDIHLTPIFRDFPHFRNFLNVQRMELVFPNGSFIRFLSGENLSAMMERKGRQFADVMIDQSELFTQQELEYLTTINRSVEIDILPKMLFCFNPGGIAHSYNKRIFYDKIYFENETSEDFSFLQVFGWDNAYWSLRPLAEDNLTIKDYHSWSDKKRFNYFITRTDYGRKLNQLPENRRKAELLGSMDVFEGMFFADFRRDIHVIEHYKFQPTWNTLAGLDYGNTTVLEILQCDYEGNVVCFLECFIDDAETPSERANRIADLLLEKQLLNLRIIYDTDMDISQISNVGYDRTPVQIFRNVFRERMHEHAPSMIVVSKTSIENNKSYRETCNDAIKEYLHVNPVTGNPKLYVSRETKQLVQEITEKIIYDPKNPDSRDFLNSGTNKPHCIDALKYAFMELYSPIKPKEDKPISHRQEVVKLSKRKTIADF